MRALRILLACVAGLLVLPAAALADNRIEIKDGEASIISDDAGIANAFEIDERGSEIRFYEPKDPKGMNTFPTNCRPGQINSAGVPIEIFCPRSAITKSILVAPGPDGDSVKYAVNGLPGLVDADTGIDTLTSTGASDDVFDGQQGNDVLDAGPGNDDLSDSEGDDTLKGGDGNDKVKGGPGSDTLDAGAGDDTIDAADGFPDKIQCGDGTDTIVVDQLDEVADGCENVEKRQVEAAVITQTGPDTKRPKLVAAALASQRAGKRHRAVKLVATSSEKGLVQVTAYIEVQGINDRLMPTRADITVGGGGVEIALKLNKRQLRLIGKDLKRHRTPRVRVTVSSVDAAGNTSQIHHLTIRLRR